MREVQSSENIEHRTSNIERSFQRYQLWPYVKLDDEQWSIPDKLLEQIYQELVSEQRDKIVFYGGGIDNFEQFIKYLKTKHNHFVFVVDAEEKKFVFIAWLNNIQARSAFCHFFAMGKYTYRKEIGELVIQYWKSTNVPIVLIGIIPEINKTAIKLAKELGFVELGTIPCLCNIFYEERVAGGTVLYYLFGGDENG